MDTLVTIANCFFILSYVVKDMLWLRSLSFFGACCLALYFSSQPQPLTQVVCWNLFFAALNAGWIGRIAYQRYFRRDSVY